MSVNDFILNCEKDNKQLRKDIEYYKRKNTRLKQKNTEYKEAIDKLSKLIYKIDDLRKHTGGYPTHYMDDLVDILKEVEHE